MMYIIYQSITLYTLNTVFMCPSYLNKTGGEGVYVEGSSEGFGLPWQVCVYSQDDYMEALARLHLTVTRAYKVNTDINFEVFIHKVDGLSDDHKIETQRDIHQRANDDLADAGLEKIHLRWEQEPSGIAVNNNNKKKAGVKSKVTMSGLVFICLPYLCCIHWDSSWEK